MDDQNQKDEDLLRRRAIRAAKAVTLGVAVAGSTACTNPEPDDDNDWPVGRDSGDVAADTSRDTAPDARVDGGSDARPTCSSMEDGKCPNHCNRSNDIDCCEESGGDWYGEGCGIPGPFVPPAMPSARA